MTQSPIPQEAQRLDALYRYQVLDALPETAFERMTRMVKRVLGANIVIVNFVAARRTWLKSGTGTNIHEMDRDSVCCNETVRLGQPFSVEDLHTDLRFRHDPMVKFEGARGYAGVPLTTPDGFHIGTFAVYETSPRRFTPDDLALLQDMAAVVMDQLELRLMTLYWKQAHQRSEHVATHDSLTGLPNRLQFHGRAREALREAERLGTAVGVMVLDLDGFKTINDSLGHEMGDELLLAVGKRLSGLVRADDVVARFGGDEFVVLLPDLREPLQAAQVAQDLQQALSQPFFVNGHVLNVNASVGISVFPNDGQDTAALLRAADTAMYQAKAAGKGRLQFYQDSMAQAAQQKLRLHTQLVRAIEQGGLQVVYQPQVDLQTGDVVGMEALLRWPQPGGQSVSPEQFIPVAEERGLIVPIGEWVLHEACAQLARWRAQGCPDWRMSVNISGHQWEDPGFFPAVHRVLEDTALLPTQLMLEVTESVLLKDSRGTQQLAAALRALGVQVALDDYGTGFSNLSQLQHLDIGQLKLDRSFVTALSGTARSLAMVRSAVTLSHGLNVPMVGEGIETHAQLEALKALACDVGQGFLLGGPVPAEEFAQLYFSA
ncbi:putative bifunctional diguanylate cyclase/phosphodiesterase [Deinococcus hohokamensis]|uniref:Bifunctional diguanylate cyclase/phosphodiesterase n=1 Tax=Deinococcus hohokamensis TaxID=309883 RepID=A0ABV9IDW0_9DEIO